MHLFLTGNAVDKLKELPTGTVDCCVTSPPYYRLRDYGVEGQIGQEDEPEEFIDKLVEVFEEVKRILVPQGTLWLNIGDTYAGTNIGGQQDYSRTTFTKLSKKRVGMAKARSAKLPENFKRGDLMGLPWLLATTLRDECGWFLKQDIIWYKPSVHPESVKNRFTRSHEYLFLLAKQTDYFFDHSAAEEESATTWTALEKTKNDDGTVEVREIEKTTRNKRDVWLVPARGFQGTKIIADFSIEGIDFQIDNRCPIHGQKKTTVQYKQLDLEFGHDTEKFDGIGVDLSKLDIEKEIKPEESIIQDVNKCICLPVQIDHYAVFPPDLVRPCILIGSPIGGTVIDPFGGAGTVSLLAKMLSRNSIYIDISPDSVKLAQVRHEKLRLMS